MQEWVDVVRYYLERLVEVGECPVEVTCVELQEAAVAERAGVSGHMLQVERVVADRRRGIATALLACAPEVTLGVVGITRGTGPTTRRLGRIRRRDGSARAHSLVQHMLRAPKSEREEERDSSEGDGDREKRSARLPLRQSRAAPESRAYPERREAFGVEPGAATIAHNRSDSDRRVAERAPARLVQLAKLDLHSASLHTNTRLA